MRSRRAFTVLEVLCALSLLAVVMGAGMQLLAGTSRQLHGATAALDRREAARRALAAIRGGLADAWGYQPDARGLTFWTAAGAGRVEASTDGTLSYRAPGEATALIVIPSGGVLAFTVSEARPGLVRLALRLAGPPVTAVDEVRVDPVAERDRLAPWNTSGDPDPSTFR